VETYRKKLMHVNTELFKRKVKGRRGYFYQIYDHSLVEYVMADEAVDVVIALLKYELIPAAGNIELFRHATQHLGRRNAHKNFT
jgi:hypothetical protein